MNIVVLDASVIARAYFNEPDSKAARRLYTRTQTILAPDLLHIEIASVLLRKISEAVIDAREATFVLAEFLSVPIRFEPTDSILPSALDLAIQTDATVYDCLYLAVAIRNDCPLVTADERFAFSCRNTSASRYIRLLSAFA